jgi:hypothetical protein
MHTIVKEKWVDLCVIWGSHSSNYKQFQPYDVRCHIVWQTCTDVLEECAACTNISEEYAASIFSVQEYISIPKAVYSSKILVPTHQITWHYIQQDSNLKLI